MRLNFLCRQHRVALVTSPGDARTLWLECCERLSPSVSTPTPYQVNLAGTALESAAIHLLAEPLCAQEDLERFTETALLLIGMLERLGHSRLAMVVVSGISAMLDHLARQEANAQLAIALTRRLLLTGTGGASATPGSRPAGASVH